VPLWDGVHLTRLLTLWDKVKKDGNSLTGCGVLCVYDPAMNATTKQTTARPSFPNPHTICAGQFNWTGHSAIELVHYGRMTPEHGAQQIVESVCAEIAETHDVMAIDLQQHIADCKEFESAVLEILKNSQQ